LVIFRSKNKTVLLNLSTDTVVFLIQHFFTLIGQDIATAAALNFRLADCPHLQELLQQYVECPGANIDPSTCHSRDTCTSNTRYSRFIVEMVKVMKQLFCISTVVTFAE